MPTAPMPACRWPGCPNLQTPGGRGYCAEHLPMVRKQDAQRRGSARQRGYTRTYEKARDWVLTRQPLCAVCRMEGRMTKATITHHLTPLAEGGNNCSDSLVGVCQACHNRLHSGEGRTLAERLRAVFSG